MEKPFEHRHILQYTQFKKTVIRNCVRSNFGTIAVFIRIRNGQNKRVGKYFFVVDLDLQRHRFEFGIRHNGKINIRKQSASPCSIIKQLTDKCVISDTGKAEEEFSFVPVYNFSNINKARAAGKYRSQRFFFIHRNAESAGKAVARPIRDNSHCGFRPEQSLRRFICRSIPPCRCNHIKVILCIMLRDSRCVTGTAGEMNLYLIAVIKYFFAKGLYLVVSAFVNPRFGINDKPDLTF